MWVMTRVIADRNDDCDGSVPDEVFGPFKTEEAAAKWAQEVLDLAEATERKSRGCKDSCMCVECCRGTTDYTFLPFEVQSKRKSRYMNHYSW